MRIKHLMFCILSAAPALAANEPSRVPSDRLVVIFFGSATCGECLEIKARILQPLQKKHPDRIELRTYEVEDETAFDLLIKLEELYGVTAPSPQTLFFPDTFLSGSDAIFAHGRSFIEARLDNPSGWTQWLVEGDASAVSATLRERFERFTFWGIVAAGLADGVNPCAIATMIFLISFLATQKRSRGEILAVGMAFTATVYVTYFLLGLGAFRLITALGMYRWLSLTIKWSAVALAGGVSLYSFRDAIVYARTGKAQDISLQLPTAVKMRIHKVISGNLSNRSLVFGSMVTGFLVTLLEAVCTGQVYLPTIILMTRDQGLRFSGILYLGFYNFLFVLPLLVIMVLAYYGLTWADLSKVMKKHMVAVKLLLGVVLAALAVFLGVAG